MPPRDPPSSTWEVAALKYLEHTRVYLDDPVPYQRWSKILRRALRIANAESQILRQQSRLRRQYRNRTTTSPPPSRKEQVAVRLISLFCGHLGEEAHAIVERHADAFGKWHALRAYFHDRPPPVRQEAQNNHGNDNDNDNDTTTTNTANDTTRHLQRENYRLQTELRRVLARLQTLESDITLPPPVYESRSASSNGLWDRVVYPHELPNHSGSGGIAGKVLEVERVLREMAGSVGEVEGLVRGGGRGAGSVEAQRRVRNRRVRMVGRGMGRGVGDG